MKLIILYNTKGGICDGDTFANFQEYYSMYSEGL